MHRPAGSFLFVVTGRNARFGAIEIGRFIARNSFEACQAARRLKAGLVGGLQLEARRA